MKDDLFRILKYRNYTFETTPLKQMYMDCFNKQCIDVAHIGSLLPKLIMFPETKKIANEKVEAAAGAFEKTWKQPVPIPNDEVDDDSSIDNDQFMEDQQEEEVRYTDPNGCSHNELTHFQQNIVKCLPVTLGFYPGNGAKQICWCPCSKAMKGWREKSNVGYLTKECEKGSMNTESLLQHFKNESGCVYHRFMKNYIEIYLCKDKGTYLGLENVGHYSLYGKSDPRYTRSFENEQEFIIFKDQEEAKKKKLLEEIEAKKTAAKLKTTPLKIVQAIANNNVDNVAVSSVGVSTMSTLTQDGHHVPTSAERRKIAKALKQKKRRKMKEETEPDKYSKVMVLGLSHNNKFKSVYEARVNEGSVRTDYVMTNGKTVLSKDVLDGIRGFLYEKHLSKMTIFSEKYATLNTQIQFHRIRKLIEEKDIVAIFFDYF